jgi:hypothetical protein
MFACKIEGWKIARGSRLLIIGNQRRGEIRDYRKRDGEAETHASEIVSRV